MENLRAENCTGSFLRIGVRVIESVVRSSFINIPNVTKIFSPKVANRIFFLGNLLRKVGKMRQQNFKKIIKVIVTIKTSQET